MKHLPPQITYKKKAFCLTVALGLTGLASLLWIVMHGLGLPKIVSDVEKTGIAASDQNVSSDKIWVADIYQDGSLLQSIILSDVQETYTFSVSGAHEAFNEIEVRPGSIGIISASCPDKLCVHQGFIENALLPITCLPNHLVIQIRTQKQASAEEITPDIIAY